MTRGRQVMAMRPGRRQVIGALALVLAAPRLAVGQDLQRFQLDLEQHGLGGKPVLIRVRRGQVVDLTVAARRSLRLFLAGYNILKVVSPARPAQFVFKADITGRFALATVRAAKDGSSRYGHTVAVLEVVP